LFFNNLDLCHIEWEVS